MISKCIRHTSKSHETEKQGDATLYMKTMTIANHARTLKKRLTEIPEPRRELPVERAEFVLDGLVPQTRLVVQMLAIPPEREKHGERNARHVQQHEQRGQAFEQSVATFVARDEQVAYKHGLGHRALVQTASKDREHAGGKTRVHELHGKNEYFDGEFSPPSRRGLL